MSNSELTNIKIIQVNLKPNKKPQKSNQEQNPHEEKEINMRKIATQWEFSDEELSDANQWQILCLINTEMSNDTDIVKQVRQQINYKINGYKGQDIKKLLYDPTLFINYDYVVSLLHQKQMRCFYCKEQTKLLYNAVRESKQWTLDRIDNSVGHNRGNVEIACLICNLRRRTMYHERYVFTKQLNLVKAEYNENI